MSRHTPGPWKQSSRVQRRDDLVTIISTNNVDLVSVHNPSPIPSNQSWYEGHANARLIAAAPYLLDALRGLLFAADDSPAYDAAITAARAAIAKAEGQQ